VDFAAALARPSARSAPSRWSSAVSRSRPMASRAPPSTSISSSGGGCKASWWRSSSRRVLAMKNDPTRALQDLADVAELVRVAGADRERVRAQFVRHGLEDRWDELARAL
jgi:hypothetical protein